MPHQNAFAAFDKYPINGTIVPKHMQFFTFHKIQGKDGKAMPNLNKRNNFMKQAGVLAIATILCRIIGMLYRSPLLRIIGDEGNGYYSTAYNIYLILLVISSYSIPSALSKEMAQRLSLGEYKNAQRMPKATKERRTGELIRQSAPPCFSHFLPHWGWQLSRSQLCSSSSPRRKPSLWRLPC